MKKNSDYDVVHESQDNDVTVYQQYVFKEMTKIENQRNLHYIKHLKMLDAQHWEEHYEQFYHQLSYYITQDNLIWILIQEDEWKYMVLWVLKNPTFHNLKLVQKNIQNHDYHLYHYLYMICLFQECQYYTSLVEYKTIYTHFDHLMKEGLSLEGIEDIAMILKQKYPRRKVFLEIIDNYINERTDFYEKN